MLKRSNKHVFISYDHEDRNIAKTLAHCLETAGIEVWWDQRLQTGQKWAQEIDQALLSATAVVVLWSNHAVQSEWVQHEASIAKIRNVLTHANIDSVSVPSIFGSIQCSNLSDWNGTCSDQNYIRLLEGIKNIRLQNKIQNWRRTALVSFTTLLITSILVYGGTILQEYRAGPSPKIAMGWKTRTDYVKININLNELRSFYDPKKWDLAFLCREKSEATKDYNSSFSIIPFNKDFEEASYKIYFHQDLADKLIQTSYIECYLSVIKKSLNLNLYSKFNEDGYDSFKLMDNGTEDKVSYNDMVHMILKNKYAYISAAICACAAEYKTTTSKPPVFDTN